MASLTKGIMHVPKRRQRKLVIGHLENISGDVLDQYPSVIRALIKDKSGVYALYRNNSLYYVGLAKNLMGRLKAHTRDRHQRKWNRFSVYLTVRDEYIKELESLMIRVVGPRGNRRSGKLIASKVLRRDLNKAIKAHDADRRARLMGGRQPNNVSRRRQPKPAERTYFSGYLIVAFNFGDGIRTGSIGLSCGKMAESGMTVKSTILLARPAEPPAAFQPVVGRFGITAKVVNGYL